MTVRFHHLQNLQRLVGREAMGAGRWDGGAGGGGVGGERYGPQLLSVNNKRSHLTSETGNSRRKDEEQTSNRKTGKLMIVGEFLQLWAWLGGGGVLQRGLINTVFC